MLFASMSIALGPASVKLMKVCSKTEAAAQRMLNFATIALKTRALLSSAKSLQCTGQCVSYGVNEMLKVAGQNFMALRGPGDL